MMFELKRAVALGAKYGLKAIPMYTDASVETPEISEEAMEGAIGIVITLAAVMIAQFGKYRIFPDAEFTLQSLSLVQCPRPPLVAA